MLSSPVCEDVLCVPRFHKKHAFPVIAKMQKALVANVWGFICAAAEDGVHLEKRNYEQEDMLRSLKHPYAAIAMVTAEMV